MLAVLTAAGGFAASTPPIAKQCQADLAKRLNVQVASVTVASVQVVEWPDMALGLPLPDHMYAQEVMPGWSILLSAGKAKYLYTATEKFFKYGGPVAAGALSALYVEPVEGDPNLNGTLIQVSLVGTNAVTLIEGVSEFRAQPNGSILATSRTSRSGFDMLYLAPGKAGLAVKVGGAFEFGDAVVSPDGKQWIAYYRQLVGAGWTIALNGVDAAWTDRKDIDLPAGTEPDRLFWEGGGIIAKLKADGKTAWYSLVKNGDAWDWKAMAAYSPDEEHDFMLNKSETLVVDAVTVDGKPSTKVARQWFTGTEKPVATLAGFVCHKATMSPTKRFVFLSGVEGERQMSYAVDIATGEKLLSVSGPQGQEAQLLRASPYDWLKHPAWYGLGIAGK
jgi:hypothetical protein